MAKIKLRPCDSLEDRSFVEHCLRKLFPKDFSAFSPSASAAAVVEELQRPYRIIDVEDVGAATCPVGILMGSPVSFLNTGLYQINWPCYWVHRLGMLPGLDASILYRVTSEIRNEAKDSNLPIAAFVYDTDQKLINGWKRLGGLKYERRKVAPLQLLLTSEPVPQDALELKPLPPPS